jgi:imidazolonepropionase-like amidohydrolase
MRSVIALALGWLLAACATAPTPPAGGLVITNVMIASPERNAAYGPTSVRIIDGRIVEIGASLRAGEGAAVIAGEGRYLSPGLIDSHVHLNDAPGLPFGAEETHPDLAAAWTAQAPRSFLYHGFTTLIDLFSSGERVAAWNTREDAPHVHFCGGAPVLDGYPTNFMPAPQRYQIISTFVINSTQTAPEGIEPARIFRAATIENAAFFGLEDVGVVAIGKQADLLLLRGNPFESVTAFDAIDLVIVDGQPIAREVLSARASAD